LKEKREGQQKRGEEKKSRIQNKGKNLPGLKGSLKKDPGRGECKKVPN